MTDQSSWMIDITGRMYHNPTIWSIFDESGTPSRKAKQEVYKP